MLFCHTKFAITLQEKKRFQIISFLEQSKYNEQSDAKLHERSKVLISVDIL